MNETDFTQRLRDNGFEVPVIKTYAPHTDGPMHVHDFSVMLLVLDGPFMLVKDADVTTYQAGEVCELAAGVRHVEQAGPAGARVLMGKRRVA